MKEETKKQDENNGKSFDATQDELKALQLKCEEYLNGWKRERADFLNYKKEEMEKIGSLVKYANEEIILKLLPILDNICLAEQHIPANTGNSREGSWVEGFLQIKKQLSDFLQKEGIEAIEVLGKPFDPNTMEAISETEAAESSGSPSSAETMEAVGEAKSARSDLAQSESEVGVVVEEVQRGYTLHGKLIRPAKVKISK